MLKKIRTFVAAWFDKESKKLFRNSSWVFLSNFNGIALAFVRSVIIARGLGAEIFGSYAIVVAFVAIIQEFLNLNLGIVIIKFGMPYHKEQRFDKLTALIKESFKTNGIMILISVCAVSLLSLLTYSTFIKKPGLEWFIVFYSFAAGTKYFNSISYGILRLHFKFKLNSLIQIIMDVVETILVALAIWLYPRNLNIFFATIIITRFMNSMICNWAVFLELKKEYQPYFKAKADLIKEEIKKIRQFVIGNSLGSSLKSLMSQGDVVLLGALAGPTQVAFYAVAKKLAYSILVLTDPLMLSIMPQFSKLLTEHSYTKIKNMLRKITLTGLFPAAIFLLLAFFFNKWIIVTIFGKEYALAGYPFFWLLAGSLFGSLTFWTLPLVQSLGLVTLRLKIYSIAIITGAGIAYILIPHFHSAGMAMALLCSNLIINISFIYESNKKMKLSEFSAPIISEVL